MARSGLRSTQAPATNSLPPVASPPKQRRAWDLLERLSAATRALLAERNFETITVADIAQRAGISVGVVYTRFATKDHLLVHLARELAPKLQARVEAALAAERTASLSMLEIAERYFLLAATAFIRHRAILRPLSLIARLEAHRELRDLTASYNAGVHTVLRDRLLAHRDRIRHDDPESAVDFAILAVSAVVREVVLYGEPVSRLSRRHRHIVRDAARLCTAFLVAGEEPAARTSFRRNRK